MMNTTTTKSAFLKSTKKVMETGVYNARLVSYNVVERDDGREAVMMNFVVPSENRRLFKYQITDSFDGMLREPVEEFLAHNGIIEEDTLDNEEFLEVMKANEVPIYYKATPENKEYKYEFYFNRRQVIEMTDNDLTYLEELYEGEYVYISDGLEHYI